MVSIVMALFVTMCLHMGIDADLNILLLHALILDEGVVTFMVSRDMCGVLHVNLMEQIKMKVSFNIIL